MRSSFRLLCSIGLTTPLALLAACAENQNPPPPALTAAEEAALVDEAAVALDRYCIDGLPDVEAIAIVMSADAGPATGKAYTPYDGPQGFIGASLRANEGYSANATRQDDGRIVCGVALFTPAADAFETAVLDQLVAQNGLVVRDPRRSADGGVAYTLDNFSQPATLSFRERLNETGESAIGAVITVASDGGSPALPEAPEIAAAPTVEPPLEPAQSAAPAEPNPPVEAARSQPEPPAPAEPVQVAAASPAEQPPAATVAPAATPQPAAEPASPTASQTAPTMPRAERPTPMAELSLYEGAPYAAFTRAQIDEFCKQDWKRRRVNGGRTEYNPCYERSAFR